MVIIIIALFTSRNVLFAQSDKSNRIHNVFYSSSAFIQFIAFAQHSPIHTTHRYTRISNTAVDRSPIPNEYATPCVDDLFRALFDVCMCVFAF